MSLLRFEIRFADGRKEVANVDGEHALIGNGAHCDIRLPLDQAANEHVAVEVVGGTVRLETLAFDPPATVNGMPFTNMPITTDVPLKIGSTRIFIALGDATFDGSPVVQKIQAEETSPAIKILGVLAAVLGAYMLLFPDEPPMVAAPAQIPELFPAVTVTCPQTAPDQAKAFASDKLDIAEGKRERSPFAPRDGVEAVQLYALASACFKVGGDGARAADADLAAKQLRTSITQDFRARRVRLEHLLAVRDFDLAKNDVRVLRALTEGKQGRYVEWLQQQKQFLTPRGTLGCLRRGPHPPAPSPARRERGSARRS